MQITSKKRIPNKILKQYSTDVLARRLIFLWDYRENDFESYRANGCAKEKEFLYSMRSGKITTAANLL